MQSYLPPLDFHSNVSLSMLIAVKHLPNAREFESVFPIKPERHSLNTRPHRTVIADTIARKPEERQFSITNICLGIVGKARMNVGHGATSNSVVMGPAGVDCIRSGPSQFTKEWGVL